ncbi:MAG: 4Fe-4S binding protein [Deltaproteobacteria bacterium]|jgi:pyruvate ferredoxin oxidoreductase delta subunit|nr:4Fe-4S binding protein [Deltaproteobacteria bacterium]
MPREIDAIQKVGDLPIGFTAKPGSTLEFKTGDWRTLRPKLHRDKCTYCSFCYVFCPDGVYQDMGPQEKYYKPDLNYCKGCGVCAHQCPKQCIEMVLEEV